MQNDSFSNVIFQDMNYYYTTNIKILHLILNETFQNHKSDIYFLLLTFICGERNNKL